MNNVKIIYYNIDTIDGEFLEASICSNNQTKSHYTVKPGLLLVNYQGTAQELYLSLGDLIKEKSILILDLANEPKSYYGFMNKDLWVWLESNN